MEKLRKFNGAARGTGDGVGACDEWPVESPVDGNPSLGVDENPSGVWLKPLRFTNAGVGGMCSMGPCGVGATAALNMARWWSMNALDVWTEFCGVTTGGVTPSEMLATVAVAGRDSLLPRLRLDGGVVAVILRLRLPASVASVLAVSIW